ncbi:MAG: hypothetical protein HY240_04945 [Actinobacteria bacterium]|nr:hypothetical protein [Actinomycetota bacterium]
MRSRSAARVYQIASRLWLTAAGVSLLLPARARLGYWLPLHLTVAGAVSTQISGAMQTFACALTATPDPPEAVVWAQFSLMTAGAGLLAFGYPTDHPAMVAAGGACLAAGAAVLGWIVWRAWRRALNRRHSLPVASYGAAVASVLLGAAFGALVGSGAVHGETWLALRRAHMTVNVLGWASLTIAGTLVTLLPTVLRVRMPAWHGGATGLLLAGGLSAAVAGLVSGLGPVVAVGTLAYAGGAAGLAWMVVRAARTPRRWPVPLAAKHLLAGVAWFVA